MTCSQDVETEEKVDYITVARQLAANTLKDRERAFKYLKGELQNESVLSRRDSLIIWKGLFFMMWHSDGLEVQEALADRMAKIIVLLKNDKSKWNFLQGGLENMNREWLGIDRLRLSKFMLLVRLLFRFSLETIGKNGWNMAEIQWFLGVLSASPLQFHHPVGKSSAPLGLRYHFTDIWTEELLKVGGSKSENPMPSAAVHEFVFCWAKVAAQTSIGAFRQKIVKQIFDDFIERSEPSINVLRSHMENNSSMAANVETMEEEGSLPLDFELLVEKTIEFMTDNENVTRKQLKAMNRVIQKFKSIADGECPMDELADWSMEQSDVDKFLYHSEEGYSKKELKKWDGVKKASSISADLTEKLEKFLELDDDRVDARVALKPKERKKPKLMKLKERAKRRRADAQQQWSEVDVAPADPDDLGPELDEPNPQVDRIIRKMKRQRKMARNLAILESDSPPAPKSAQLSEAILKTKISEPSEKLVPQEKEEETIIKVKKRNEEPPMQSLAELAEKIRKNIDNLSPNEKSTGKKKKGKKVEGRRIKVRKIVGRTVETDSDSFCDFCPAKDYEKAKRKIKG